MLTNLKTTVALACVAVCAAGCGGSSQDALAQHAKASIKAIILKDNNTANPDLPFNVNSTQAGCFADKAVDTIGVPALQRAGQLDKHGNAISNDTSTGHLSEADAKSFVDSMFGCIDRPTLLSGVNKMVSSGMTGASAASIACVQKKVTLTVAREVYVDALSGADAKLQPLLKGLFQGCQ